MAFWGTEVKPGKPYTHRFDNSRGRLHLSQATLGNGSSTKKSSLQCKTGGNQPIYLCSLLPDVVETCALNLEFDKEDEIIFSVQGPQSIHLSGFFFGDSEDAIGDAYESDSYGEELSGTESDDSSEYDSEDGFTDDSLDDDLEMHPSSTVPNKGVVIEEIVDDDKPGNNNETSKHGKKKKHLTSSDDKNSKGLVVMSNTKDHILESEDEDGLPVPFNDKINSDALSVKEKLNEVKDHRSKEEAKKKKAKDEASLRTLKRKLDAIVKVKKEKSKTGQQPSSSPADAVVAETETKKKKEKKRKRNADNKEDGMQLGDESHQTQSTEKNLDNNANTSGEETEKNKKEENGADATVRQAVTEKKEFPLEKSKGKRTQVRTFPNGLVIEEVAMGKPDGKKASPGKKVCVQYTGKLQNNGDIFDSNVGSAPFEFRLGVGQVIKGWDVGVSGMRVGDKRRLTIPPAMGYGDEGARQTIPPNSWLVFDIELVSVT